MYVSNAQALVDKKISFTLMIAVFPHNNFIGWLGYAFYYTVKRKERERELERIYVYIPGIWCQYGI